MASVPGTSLIEATIACFLLSWAKLDFRFQTRMRSCRSSETSAKSGLILSALTATSFRRTILGLMVKGRGVGGGYSDSVYTKLSRTQLGLSYIHLPAFRAAEIWLIPSCQMDRRSTPAAGKHRQRDQDEEAQEYQTRQRDKQSGVIASKRINN